MIRYTPNKIGFSGAEVVDFMRTFPCSGLRERSYWFEFDSEGNLIDTDVPEHDDGPGATALCEQAHEYWQGLKDITK